MTRSNPGTYSIAVGAMTVTALNDGQFEASLDLLQGIAAAEGEALLHATMRVLPPRITVSCFLLEFADRRVLVDSGAGALFGPALGRTHGRLADLGVAPETVDMVLLTHAHGDHVGGLLNAAGGPAFPRAELVVNGAELDHWRGLDAASAGPQQHAFAAYDGRLRRASDGEAVLPGVTLQHLPGHTPGHSGYHLQSDGDALLIWGDIVHLPGIQFARPEAGVAYDHEGALARETRVRILDQAVAGSWLVAGMHHDFPLFGHVRRLAAGTGYGFEPVVWTPDGTRLAPG